MQFRYGVESPVASVGMARTQASKRPRAYVTGYCVSRWLRANTPDMGRGFLFSREVGP
jgi:hypothetical protein